MPLTELKPQEITNPYCPVEPLMPAYDNIPEEFKKFPGTQWNKLVNDWFFSGIRGLVLEPKDGIDQQKALRHIKVIMASYEPKHEHKEAACAYLFSLWFKDAKWMTNKGD